MFHRVSFRFCLLIVVACNADLSDSSSDRLNDSRPAIGTSDTVQKRNITDVTLADGITGEGAGDDTSGVPVDSGGADMPSPVTFDIEVAGVYQSDYYAMVVITDTHWGADPIAKYDNSSRVVVVGEKNIKDELTYSKYVWLQPDSEGEFWVCKVHFGSSTVQAAWSGEDNSDASSPSERGCGNFGWTRMVPTLEVHGMYDGPFKEGLSVTHKVWGGDSVMMFDNHLNVAVVSTELSGFQKLVWMEPESWRFFYCAISSGHATASAARDAQKTPDASSPETSGCLGSKWNELRVPVEVKGAWKMDGADVLISTFAWNGSPIAKHNNKLNIAITRSAGKGTYSRITWHGPFNDGSYRYCEDVKEFDSIEAAEATFPTAVTSGLDIDGCHGKPWGTLIKN